MESLVFLADKNSNAWDFAEKIQDYIKLNKQESLPLYAVPISKFRNKETWIDPAENIRKKEVYYIADSTKTPNDLWVELMLVKDMALRASVNSYNLILPDMPYQRQDRKDKPRVPISARAFADAISPGTKRIITMDLHADQIQGFYPSTTPLDPLKSFPVVAKYLISNHKEDLENILIVAPDQGEVKRALSFQRRLEKIGIGNSGFGFMIKGRKKVGEIEKMRYAGEDPDGKDILLLDDIIDSGNTLCSAATVLREKGAQKLMAYGTHGLFTKGTCELKTYFDNIFTSNTHNSQAVQGIEVIDVSPLFAEAIYRAQKGSSISELFH
jgi:ribose-phosphate pyrophosphokinase